MATRPTGPGVPPGSLTTATFHHRRHPTCQPLEVDVGHAWPADHDICRVLGERNPLDGGSQPAFRPIATNRVAHLPPGHKTHLGRARLPRSDDGDYVTLSSPITLLEDRGE